jgi:hypothetical protein
MGVEYKFVTYHPGNKSADVDANITKEINAWAAAGWRIFKVIRPTVIGPISLVLERERN